MPLWWCSSGGPAPIAADMLCTASNRAVMRCLSGLAGPSICHGRTDPYEDHARIMHDRITGITRMRARAHRLDE
jgi:hypothetical protein